MISEFYMSDGAVGPHGISSHVGCRDVCEIFHFAPPPQDLKWFLNLVGQNILSHAREAGSSLKATAQLRTRPPMPFSPLKGWCL